MIRLVFVPQSRVSLESSLYKCHLTLHLYCSLMSQEQACSLQSTTIQHSSNK